MSISKTLACSNYWRSTDAILHDQYVSMTCPWLFINSLICAWPITNFQLFQPSTSSHPVLLAWSNLWWSSLTAAQHWSHNSLAHPWHNIRSETCETMFAPHLCQPCSKNGIRLLASNLKTVRNSFKNKHLYRKTFSLTQTTGSANTVAVIPQQVL